MSNKLFKFLTVSVSCCIVTTFMMNATHAQTQGSDQSAGGAQTQGSEQKSAGGAIIGQAVEIAKTVSEANLSKEAQEALSKAVGAPGPAVIAAGNIAGRTPDQILADSRANGVIISKEEEPYYLCLAQGSGAPEVMGPFKALEDYKNNYKRDPAGWKLDNALKEMDTFIKLNQDLRAAYADLDKKCKG